MMDEFPPGFRFYPTEEELVSFYLHNKLEGNGQDLNRVIPVVNVYELEPWHLPEVAGELCHGDSEQWFFFVPRQEREARGGRPNRTTGSGYWKATGSPNYIYSSDNRVIGVKKTMVFYKGKAPTGRKTKWKMNEYREIILEEMENPHGGFTAPKLRHELSLCRVYVVSGCLRSFDRRPLGPETRDTAMVSGSLRSLDSQQPLEPETRDTAMVSGSLRSFDRRPLGPETRDTAMVSGSLRSLDSQQPLEPETRNTVVVPKANVMNLEVAYSSQSL